MGSRIGAHSQLRALLWDSAVHSFDPKSHGGAHRVVPEAMSEVKTQPEAKLHMYYFILMLTTLM
jgi:hypothetical protein